MAVKGSTSFVLLVVELVENLLQNVFDVFDVAAVVVLLDVVVRQLVDLVFKPLDGAGEVVDDVDGQKASHAHNQVKQLLIVHLARVPAGRLVL